MPPKKGAAKNKKPATFVFEFSDLALIGQPVRKEFEGVPPTPQPSRRRPPPHAPAWRGASGFGIFTGRVSNIDKATGYFTISYEDGDDEELQRDELQKLLAKSAKLPPAAAAAAPPRSGITAKEFASATLHDFMRNTSSAARRKRKHTDLVRRGVFKERLAVETKPAQASASMPALRRLLSAPEHAPGCPKLRPASVTQPPVPRSPATPALFSTLGARGQGAR